jgi:hypothetical protein
MILSLKDELKAEKTNRNAVATEQPRQKKHK